MKIIKRNGSEENLTKKKIFDSIVKANDCVPEDEKLTKKQIQRITDEVVNRCLEFDRPVTVDEVEDIVEKRIMANSGYELAKQYICYRFQKEKRKQKNTTDSAILSLLNNTNEEIQAENANKNPTIVSTMRDYMAGETSKDLARRYLIPPDVMRAHDEGMIHFHDMDYSIAPLHNCDLINLEDMLQNGTVISGTMIEKPHSFSTACNITTQIVAQVASSQYGGQTFTLSHLAPFVDVSRQCITKEVEREFSLLGINDEQKKKEIVEGRLREEINRGVQTIQYQILTLMTTNGQTPFVSVNMYLGEVDNEKMKDDLAMIIEEFLKQRIQGVKNPAGSWIAPTFPKLLYVLEEDNIHEDSKYFYLTKLAVDCVTKRMVPDFISEKMMKTLKIDKTGTGRCYPCMGCRSFLTPYVDPVTNKPKYYGRFNQGVVTINLVDIALSSGKDYDKFWKIFDERLELCHKALRIRHEHLIGTKSDVAPILWQHGALARLKPGEKIDALLYGGYSTISLGYVGLYETVKYMTGKSHTDDKAKEFGIAVMQKLNDACKHWKTSENIDYSVYGTPEEQTTFRFAKCLQRRFGVIDGITDKNYVTNSYHIPVFEKINAFDKIRKEAEFQKLSPGGAISYIETPNMEKNKEAIMSVVKYIYDTILYCEINTQLTWCMECGGQGTVKMIKGDDGKLRWQCFNCGNHDHTRINAVVRLCGYLGSANTVNQGRMADIHDRVFHL